MTPDIADIIAGELKVSRGTAYDLMREALKQTEQPAAWVGLTDEEVDALMGSPNVGFSYRNQYAIAFAKVIDAKLREKNGGAV